MERKIRLALFMGILMTLAPAIAAGPAFADDADGMEDHADVIAEDCYETDEHDEDAYDDEDDDAYDDEEDAYDDEDAHDDAEDAHDDAEEAADDAEEAADDAEEAADDAEEAADEAEEEADSVLYQAKQSAESKPHDEDEEDDGCAEFTLQFLAGPGKPVSGITVVLSEGDDEDDGDEDEYEYDDAWYAETDEKGEVSFELPYGSYLLQVYTPVEYLPFEDWLDIDADDDEGTIAITVEEAATVSGRLVDGEGKPLAGIYVYTTELPESAEVWEYCFSEEALADLDEAYEDGDEDHLVAYFEECDFDFGDAVTDDNGKFTIGWLDGGAYVAIAQTDVDDFESEEFWLGAGEDIDLGEIMLVEGSSILGRVVGPDGKAIPGVAWLILEDGTVVWDETDEEGRFELEDLDPATYSVTVEATTEGSPLLAQYEDVTVVLGKDTDTGDWKLDEGSRVTGNVTQAGKGVGGAIVTLYSDTWGGEAWTDGNGSWWMAGVPPGNYSVYVEAPEGSADTYIDASAADAPKVVSGKDLDYSIMLEAPGILTGFVTDAQGKPVKGADVSVWSDDDDGGWAQTGADGRFTIEVPADGYVIVVDAPSAAPFYLWDEVNVASGATTWYNVSLKQEGVNLTGKATSNGKPKADLSVLAIGKVKGEVIFVDQVVTDKSGAYKFDFVPDADYEITVSDGSRSVSTTVKVAGAAATAPAVDLKGGK